MEVINNIIETYYQFLKYIEIKIVLDNYYE